MKRLIIIAVLGVVAAACSPSDSAETTTTTTTLGTGGTVTTVAAGASATTSTTVADVSVGSGNLDECMVGTWELDADAFFQVISDSLAGSDAPGEFVHLGGVNQITASADGTFVDERIDWRFGVVTGFGNLEMTVNHTQTGTWSAAGDVVSTTITDTGTPDFTMAIDGLPFEIPGGALPVEPPETSIDAAVAACSETTLLVTADDITSTWTRTS